MLYDEDQAEDENGGHDDIVAVVPVVFVVDRDEKERIIHTSVITSVLAELHGKSCSSCAPASGEARVSCAAQVGAVS